MRQNSGINDDDKYALVIIIIVDDNDDDAGVLECHGLSVDWVSNHIYWTDSGRQTVEVANYDGTGRRILIGYNLKIPRGIIVDPVFG